MEPARLIRPSDDEKFTDPLILAYLSTHGNIVYVRREVWEARKEGLDTKLLRLTQENPIYWRE